MSVRDDLQSYIKTELVEFIQKSGYPIKQTYALDAFFSALDDNNFTVKISDETKEADIIIPVFCKDSFVYNEKISFNNILGGTKTYFPSSTRSLNESLRNIYNSIENQIDQNNFDLNWDKYKRWQIFSLQNSLDKHLRSYIKEEQENILEPLFNEDLQTNLFEEVYQYFPEIVYSNAKEKELLGEKNEDEDSNPEFLKASQIIDLDTYDDFRMRFDQERFISTTNELDKVFHAQYFYKLAEAKGYPLRGFVNNENEGMKLIVANGYDALTNGSYVFKQLSKEFMKNIRSN